MAARASVQVEVLIAAISLQEHRAQVVDELAVPTYAVPLRQSAGSYDYRYDAEHRADVEGDGAWHAVSLGAADVGLTPSYVCVPSMEDKAYRTVTVRNRSSQALLAGGADVTLGNEFLMTVPFPAIAPRGEERVGLGVEEAIKKSPATPASTRPPAGCSEARPSSTTRYGSKWRTASPTRRKSRCESGCRCPRRTT